MTLAQKGVLFCSFIALLLFRLLLLDNHGLYYDAQLETAMVRDNINLITEHYAKGDFAHPEQHILKDLAYYGTFFNGIAYIFQSFSNAQDLAASSEAHLIKLKVLTVFYAFGGACLVWLSWMTTRSIGWALLPLLILELTPLYFGYGTNNVKDIPFAVLFTFSSACMAYGIPRLMEKHAPLRLLLLIGVAIGLAASVRLPGVILYAYGFFTAVFLSMLHERFREIGKALLCRWVFIGLIMFATIWLLHPVSWPQPLQWMLNALRYLAHHPLNIVQPMNGTMVSSVSPPWYYIPVWFFATMPLLWCVFAATGGIAVARAWKSSLTFQACVLLMGLQLLGIPLLMIAAKSSIYDGIRHLLFTLPAFAFFAMLGIRYVYLCFRPRLRTFAIALMAMACAAIAYDMARLHPLQHSYFNELARKHPMAEHWVLDVWQFADKEIAGWLEANVDPAIPIYTTYPSFFKVYLKSERDIVMRRANEAYTRPYYVVTLGNQLAGDSCINAHQITRKLGGHVLTMTNIYYCI